MDAIKIAESNQTWQIIADDILVQEINDCKQTEIIKVTDKIILESKNTEFIKIDNSTSKDIILFKDEFGESLPSLPLKHSGNIIAGNALRIDWNSIFSNSKLDQEIFILGNPPYLGFAQQTVAQKEEIKS